MTKRNIKLKNLFTHTFTKLFQTAGLKISSAVSMLAFTLLIARNYSLVDSGLILYFISLILLGAIIGTFGLGLEVTRQSALLDTNKPYARLALLFKILCIPVFLYVLAFLLLSSTEYLISNSSKSMPLYLVLSSACLLSINKFICAILQGLGDLKKSILLDQILWILLSSFAIVLASIFFDKPDIFIFELISSCIAISVLITILIFLIKLTRLLELNILSIIKLILKEMSFSQSDIKLLARGFWLSILMALTPFLTNFISGLLLLNGEDGDLAIFQVSGKLVAIIALMPVVFNYVFTPEISKHFANKNQSRLTDLYVTSRNTLFLLTIPAILFLITYASEVMSLFGSSYITGNKVIVILLLGQLVSSYFGSTVTFLVLSNKAKWASISGIIAMGISIIIYYIFEWLGGKIEEVFLIVIFQFFWNWFCCIGVKHTLKIKVFYLPSARDAWRQICSIIV